MINQGALSLHGEDARSYRQLAKLYDQKNYRKGLKKTEKLLQIHPEHPQTTALKSLFELALGEDKKALQSAKQAVFKGKMKSSFCWHTYGTVYRHQKNFVDAAKCFQQASRNNPTDINMLRESACSQIQVRDHAGHVSARMAMVQLKPNQIQNWLGFTLANHLRGDYPTLLRTLVSLHNFVLTIDLKPIQLSHYFIYRACAFLDASEPALAQADLCKNQSSILDDVIYHQLLLKTSLQLNKPQEADKHLSFLLKKFPENKEYILSFKNLHKLEERAALKRARKEFGSKVAKVYELCCIEDEEQFRNEFALFAKAYLQKNLISLFGEIRVVYEAGKHALIGQVLEQFEATLKDGHYPDGEKVVSPSESLWIHYLLAQHYSLRFESLDRGLSCIETAIKHTPTVPQFYSVKKDILMKQHRNIEALLTGNEARKMDLADRYMNNDCVKCLLQCGMNQLGQAVMRMFLRDDSSLYELQNQWYIVEVGRSLLIKGHLAAGLRHLKMVETQFHDMLGNEFDFHSYCLRKWTLREYTELVAFNDNLFADHRYFTAAALALKYLCLLVAHPTTPIIAPPANQPTPAIQAFHHTVDYYGTAYAEVLKTKVLEEGLEWACHIASATQLDSKWSRDGELYGETYSYAIRMFVLANRPLLVLRCLNKLETCPCSAFRRHLSCIEALHYFQKWLESKQTNHALVIEYVEAYVNKTLKGKSLAEYNHSVTEAWSVRQEYQFLTAIKLREAEIIVREGWSKAALVPLYIEELKKSECLQEVFYIVHELEYYGEINEAMRNELHGRFAHQTSYFSKWEAEVEKLSDSTWTMWWLSQSDILREEKEEREHKESKQNYKKKTKQATHQPSQKSTQITEQTAPQKKG